MTAPNLVLAIDTLTSLLDEHQVDYVIGGAVALSYWTAPRATIDIDITVDIDVLRLPELLRELKAVGAEIDEERAIAAAARGDFGGRLHGVRLDLFLPTLSLTASALERRRRVPFGERSIFVMSPEDVLLHKLLFGRTKDFADIERLVAAQGATLDSAYIEHWIGATFPADDARIVKFRQIR